MIKVNTAASRSHRMQARSQVKNEQYPTSNGTPEKKIKKEEKTPSKATSTRKGVTFDEGDNRPSKRMKVDHDEQVNQLFKASEDKLQATVRQKRLAFTMI